MTERKITEVDKDWLKKNRIQQLSWRIDAHIEKEMLEIEKLLEDYLAAMLDLTHRQLVSGRISLSQYYRDTQMLANCAARLNK